MKGRVTSKCCLRFQIKIKERPTVFVRIRSHQGSGTA